jgi:protein transport protein SEC24
VCQPFHSPREDENPVPLVTSFGNSGPPRCGKCRAYVNVWCRWVRGGERWVCNLCGGENESESSHRCLTKKGGLEGRGEERTESEGNRLTDGELASLSLSHPAAPQDYYSHLEAGDSSRRMDADQRPELCLGTVDFLVGSEYYSTNPPPSTPTAINARPSKPSNPSSQQQSSSNNSKPILSQSSDPTTSITETTTNLLDTLALAGAGAGDGGGREQRRPRALHHLFALDVGWNASSCGLIQEWCESLRAALYVPEGSEGGSEGSSVVVVGEEESSGSGEKKSGGCRLAKDEKIGIVTFDSSIHFWDLAVSRIIFRPLGARKLS